MSLYTLATGILIADPQQRRAANGNDYATGAMRVPTEDAAAVVSIIAFDQAACDALLAHRKGDALSVSGRSKLTAWTGRDGETRHGISVVAEQVISAHQAATRARKHRNGEAGRRQDRSRGAPPVPPPPGWDIPPEAGDLSDLP
ncbi:MAG: single-stranded DNA-binding protein [Pseudomonadota bacterium]